MRVKQAKHTNVLFHECSGAKLKHGNIEVRASENAFGTTRYMSDTFIVSSSQRQENANTIILENTLRIALIVVLKSYSAQENFWCTFILSCTFVINGK